VLQQAFYTVTFVNLRTWENRAIPRLNVTK